jgi:type IV secretory pathway VirB6-like protein
MILLDEPWLGLTVVLAVVLIVSIAAGSLLMVAVSVLLLGVVGALAYRARQIERNLD